MKKSTLVFSFFMATLALNAQVVSTVFGSTAGEGIAEWTEGSGPTFNKWLPEDEPDNGRIQPRNSSKPGVATYTGTYSRTLSSTDVIYVKIKNLGISTGPRITNLIVSYKQNDGTTETQTLVLPATTDTEEITVTPGFTDGATLSELTMSFTEADGISSKFIVYKIYEFKIGPDVTLSSRSNIIEGASVTGSNGKITVKGAELETVYSITGQKVRNNDLPSGIYIVKISKDNKLATVKVVV